uniref:Replicase n=1 Tax=Guadeloupe mosquito mononega-like virus TaxID=2607732 RepID=A0A5C1K374_9MONO|nr:RNA-dependent RNA polymerase [Guadeloupe mosquito mononega-like virus]
MNVNDLLSALSQEAEDDMESSDNLREKEDNLIKERYKKVRDRLTFIQGHLSSPIVETDALFILEVDDDTVKNCKRHRVLKEKLTTKFKGCRHISSVYKDPIGFVQDWIKSTRIPDTTHDFNLCLGAMDNLLVHKMNFLKPYFLSAVDKSLVKSKIMTEIHECKVAVQKLFPVYLNMRRAEHIKDIICYKELPEGELIKFNNLWAEQDICVLVDVRGPLILSTNLLLCALDKVQSRFGLEAYWAISDALGKYPTCSILQEGNRLLALFEHFRSLMGQDFFSLVGSYESLVVGWVVADPSDAGCLDLFRAEYSSSVELLSKYGLGDKAVELLPRNRTIYNVLIGLELTGVVKSFGYPTLVAERMLDQIFEYGTTTKFEINHDYLRMMEGVMRREMCTNYYKKHNKYPPIISCPPSLTRLLRNKPLQESAYKLYTDWSSVIFGKTFEFDYVPDQADMIKDSASAVNRSAWACMYDKCAFKHKYGKSAPRYRPPIYKTRTIEAYLNSSEGEIRKLIERQDGGCFDLEDWICVECQKECELKGVSGRAFTKQTPPRRLVQTTMEHNIATQIFPYVPEQSMTDSEIKNAQRILHQVDSMQRTSIFVSLDLKKWCLNWRHEVVEGTGRMYDELFGLKTLYKNSHLFFVGCLVLSNNRLTPPDYDAWGEPIESEVCCKSFVGAMEGMCQKFWTHPTGALIRLVMETTNVSGDIMGQGDNQVIVLHFAKDDTQMESKLQAFLQNLSVGFQGMNHELKRKETWWSKYLHEYSKQRMYKGVSVSLGTKKASKIMPDNNDGAFSFASSMSTLNTTTEGIAKADNKPDAAFLINQFFQANFLLRKKILPQNIDKRELCGVLLWPVDFGGLPISSYHDHAVRGNDDKVALWLGVYLDARDEAMNVTRVLEKLWVVKPDRVATSAKDRARLYEDIHSLKVPVPPSCEAKMRDLIERALRDPSFVTNPGIRRLYDSNLSIPYDTLIDAVDRIRPNYLPASHELLASSNVGRLLQLRGKLVASRTLQKVVQLTENVSLIDLIRDKNCQFTRYIRNALDKLGYPARDALDKVTCPTSGAGLLRQMCWGIDTVDVSKPPVSHQVVVKPMDQCTVAELNQGITVRVSGLMEMSPRECYLNYGSARYFIGSTTKLKTKKSTVNIIEKSSFVKNLRKIGTIRSWFEKIGDHHILQLCTALMEEKRQFIKELPDDLLDLGELCDSVTSGNLLHRFQSSVERNSAMLNCLPSIAGHFEYTSNSMLELAGGGRDLTIFYQYIMVAVTVGLSMFTNITGASSGSYMILFPCSGCTRDIPDIRLKYNGSLPALPYVHIPMRLPASSVAIEYTYPEARSIMSISVGYSLAWNIEENFRVHHAQGVTSLTSMDYKKNLISLNDLRLLDLRVVIGLALISSRHGNRLFWLRDRLIMAKSDDRSFMYIAECILESGLIGKAIELFRTRPSEHSSVTTIHGLASYLSQHAGQFLDRDGGEIIEESCRYLFRDSSPYQVDNVLEFAANWKYVHRKIDSKTRNLVLNELRTTKNLGKVVRKLKVSSSVLTLDLKDAITIWRNTDRNVPVELDYKPLVTSLPIPRLIDYPIQLTHSYHTSRVISAGEPHRYSIPQVSFIARRVGVISTAVNKFIEVLLLSGLLPSLIDADPFHMFCLAEGSGGTVTGLLSLFPQATALYNTWLRADIANRDRVNDRCVPAAIALRMDPGRFVKDHPLIVGETDITKPAFLVKLSACLIDYKPAIITIDAESPEGSLTGGSNLQFLHSTVKTILDNEHIPYVIILKMFVQKNTPALVAKFFEGTSKKWSHFFIKPISSNPVGNEAYLIVTHTSVIPADDQGLSDHQTAVLGYLINNVSMTKENYSSYLSVAHMVGSCLQHLTHSSIWYKPPYLNWTPATVGCGLHCKRYLDRFTDMVDRIHLNEKDVDVFLCIRMKATNGTLRDILHDLVYLMTYHHCPKFWSDEDKLINLCFVRINQDLGAIRADLRNREPISMVTCEEMGIWRSWKDARMYLSSLPEANRACTCVEERRYLVKTKTRDVKKESLMSYHVWNSLSKRGLVVASSYGKMIREAEKPFIYWKDNGCNTVLESDVIRDVREW